MTPIYYSSLHFLFHYPYTGPQYTIVVSMLLPFSQGLWLLSLAVHLGFCNEPSGGYVWVKVRVAVVWG